MDHSDQGGSELCLVLVGSIGCGKTLTADTLLGQSSAPGPSSSSRSGQLRHGRAVGRRVCVLETPRWYWRGHEVEADIQDQTLRFLRASLSGPFVLLILIPVGEFTEMERRIPDQLERMFGRTVLTHTLVLLTCGEYLMGRSLQEYVHKEAGLQEVLRRCGQRCHVICNRKPDAEQVVTLLEKVEQMMQRSGGFELEAEAEGKLRDALWNGGVAGAQSECVQDLGEVMESRRVNGLQTQRHDTHQTHGSTSPTHTSPGFRLNREGAILSQMMEEPEEPSSFTNTFHHSIQRLSSSSECDGPVGGAAVPELRLVLLGPRGSGKSAVGNLLLGREALGRRREDGPAEPERCARADSLLRDTRVTVVEMPDCFDPQRSPEELRAQISSCVSLLAPGPHAFLLCVPVDRPAQPGLLGALEGAFGPAAIRRHTLVLFTRSDLLQLEEVEQVEAYIASRQPEMLELVRRCGDRYHVLRPGGSAALLEKLQQTLREGGGGFYSCPLLQDSAPIRREPARALDAVREEDEEPQQESPHPSTSPSVLRSVCGTVSSGARRVPALLWAGALSGAALGLFLCGAAGGAVGAALGIGITHISRRRFSKHKTQ